MDGLKRGLLWFIQDIQVFLRENLPTGDVFTGGKMLREKLSLPDFATVHTFQPSPGSTFNMVLVTINLDEFKQISEPRKIVR